MCSYAYRCADMLTDVPDAYRCADILTGVPLCLLVCRYADLYAVRFTDVHIYLLMCRNAY